MAYCVPDPTDETEYDSISIPIDGWAGWMQMNPDDVLAHAHTIITEIKKYEWSMIGSGIS